MSALYLSSIDGHVAVRGDVRYRLENAQTYSEWNWDGERLAVANCPLGMHPLFWRAVPNGVAVATSPIELLEPSVELDYPALAVFVRLGWFVGEDTPFKGITQLAPNSSLSWTAGEGIRLRVGERPSAAPSSIGRQDAMHRYAELFRQAMQRCQPIDGRLFLPLSGGRDSRHIAFALNELGVRPVASGTLKHLPGRADEDVRVAKLLAEALGIPHVVLEQPRFYVRNIERLLHDTALCADDGAQMYPLIDWLKSNATVTFDGIAGDMMSTGVFQHGGLAKTFLRGDMDFAARELFRRWAPTVRGWRYAVGKTLADELSEDVAHQRLAVELERHRHNHNPSRSFFFWNRTRREIALQPFSSYRGLRVETPFLDLDLWRFLESLPYDMVGNSTFHTQTIQLAYPQFAHVPFENADARRSTTRMQRAMLGADLVATLLRRGGMRAAPILPRCVRLFAGVRIWWNPNMLLYMLALTRISKDSLKASPRAAQPQYV